MVGWIRRYELRWLKTDLIAGIAVAALIVPKNLGYAGIAGVPLQNGLYAAAAGAILYAIFGTSRQISTGPSSGLAAVAASAVAVAGISGIHNVAAFVAMITLVSSVLFLLLAVLKMGWIAQFLSRAVVTGFLFGAAIDVVTATSTARNWSPDRSCTCRLPSLERCSALATAMPPRATERSRVPRSSAV